MMTGWTMGFEGWLWMGAWALVLVLVVWLLVREPHRPGPDDPVAVLRGRLARGEITADEFERARRLLEFVIQNMETTTVRREPALVSNAELAPAVAEAGCLTDARTLEIILGGGACGLIDRLLRRAA